MSCLDDADDSIRLRALDLLSGMVSKKNLMEIVKKLMSHMAKAEGTTYRFVYRRLRWDSERWRI
jgi:AP-3 complex subunit delta-1